MSRCHLVRVGVLGNVGRFSATDATRYPRGSRVIVRTERGLETAEVLDPPEADDELSPDGAILRGMTVEDELLEARLQRHREEAYEACRMRLDERGIDVPLLDVEHLFDGRTLVFYFLGEQTPEMTEIAEDLAEVYETTSDIDAFAELLESGCGPGCGTDEATGGGCSTCTTGCAVASVCVTRRKRG